MNRDNNRARIDCEQLLLAITIDEVEFEDRMERVNKRQAPKTFFCRYVLDSLRDNKLVVPYDVFCTFDLQCSCRFRGRPFFLCISK